MAMQFHLSFYESSSYDQLFNINIFFIHNGMCVFLHDCQGSLQLAYVSFQMSLFIGIQKVYIVEPELV